MEAGTAVELLGRNSKRNNVTRLQAILAGHERDRLPARTTRSRQSQRRLSEESIAKLVVAYAAGGRINDLATTFGVSRTAVMHHLQRQGVESRRGVVNRRLDEARSLYEHGWSLAQIAAKLEVSHSTVGRTLKLAGVTLRPRPGR